jgi:ribonuclease BN (tRNA processing enzyme)
MRFTVLGGCGAWPEAGQACSGFLVEQDGFHLLIDLGYATVPRLFERVAADQVDAVFISHGHPDHCADLNPLLRARALGGVAGSGLAPRGVAGPGLAPRGVAGPGLAPRGVAGPGLAPRGVAGPGPPPRGDPPPLPVYAPPGALDAVLALDRPGMLAGAYTLHEFTAGASLGIGPFAVTTRLLPHWLPNAGVRLAAGDTAIAYTGDTGPAAEIAELARGAGLLVAEASYVDRVPEDSRRYLSSARQAGQHGAQAGAGHLVLTHLMPGTDHQAARAAASASYGGDVSVAVPGLALTVA